jgi:hypothetical protein
MGPVPCVGRDAEEQCGAEQGASASHGSLKKTPVELEVDGSPVSGYVGAHGVDPALRYVKPGLNSLLDCRVD